MENSKTDFITVINSILVLIDYQINLLKSVGSGDRKEIKNAAVASAKAASLLHIPVVLTSVNPTENGELIRELTDLFPKQEVLRRLQPVADAFEDPRVLREVKKRGRQKLIISGLFTGQSFVQTALHGIREGFDVYGLIDAGGDKTGEAHTRGVQKMLESGVTPLTWMSLTAEWMNGWAIASDGESAEEEFGKYSVMLSYLSKRQPLVHYK